MSCDKCEHNQDGIKRKEIRGEGDNEVVSSYNDVAPFGRGFELFDTAAKQPGPERVGQLMTEYINEHRFRQQEIDHAPTTGTGKNWNPSCVGAAGGTENQPKC